MVIRCFIVLLLCSLCLANDVNRRRIHKALEENIDVAIDEAYVGTFIAKQVCMVSILFDLCSLS